MKTQASLYNQLVELLTFKQYVALMGGDMSYRFKATRAMELSKSKKIHALAAEIIGMAGAK